MLKKVSELICKKMINFNNKLILIFLRIPLKIYRNKLKKKIFLQKWELYTRGSEKAANFLQYILIDIHNFLKLFFVELL